MSGRKISQGAEVIENGVHYRVWAPGADRVVVRITPPHGVLRVLPLERESSGYHSAVDPEGAAGDLYLFELAPGRMLPCPASRHQASEISGASEVVDPKTFPWTDQTWSRPAFRDLVIYELHVGTFTPGGTFRACIERLPYLRDLGVNAIELMPLADFPGDGIGATMACAFLRRRVFTVGRMTSAHSWMRHMRRGWRSFLT